MRIIAAPAFGAAALACALLATHRPATAEQFIGFGQPGTPGWEMQSYPTVNRVQGDRASLAAETIVAWFSDGGFTGTQRDQFEFWFGGTFGHADPRGAERTTGWGASTPTLGAEYYYNLIEPRSQPDDSGYLSWWISPVLTLNFPTGPRATDRFGDGSDQYSSFFTVTNYLQVGRIGATINPVSLFYAARDRSASVQGDGASSRKRGGLSWTLGELAAGYFVTPDLALGLHHAFHIDNRSRSSFEGSRIGRIGPALSYNGWARHGISVSANLNFSYYTSSNRARETTLATFIGMRF